MWWMDVDSGSLDDEKMVGTAASRHTSPHSPHPSQIRGVDSGFTTRISKQPDEVLPGAFCGAATGVAKARQPMGTQTRMCSLKYP